MAVTISLAAIFGLILFGLLRSRDLGYGAAFVAVMFGYFLASTGVSGPINDVTGSVVRTIHELDF